MQIVLTVTSGPHEGRQFSFDGHDNFIVGRSKAAQFRLPMKDHHFSRNHFLVEVNPPHCRLLDLNSTNGTLVNGRQVTSIELHDGDTIEAGDTTLRLSLVSTVASVPIPGTVSETAPAARPPAAPELVSEQTIAPRPGARNVPEAAPSSPAVATVAPRHLRKDEAIATTLVPDSKPAPRQVSPTAVPAAKNSVSAEDFAKIAAQFQPFDDYEIIEELGRGGMGVVYRARAKSDGTLVALKVVLPAVASSPDDLTRFVREADIVKELSHPHIVPFRDLGHANGQLYFVMDLVPGIDGQAVLRHHDGPLPVARGIGIVCQLLEALSAAHRQGYVHRDVKPSNLLIEARADGDFVWLADFGLARAYQASKLSGLTTTGNIGGTLPYMAPEQITHYRDVTPAADQYSAAATLYHLLTRKFPYDFPKEIARQLLMVLQEPPRPIQEHRAELSDKLAAVIHKGLARIPAERFADAEAFRIALLGCSR
ncbi:MAG: protein kinase [Candidatus Saccharimonas sp.]|nr:protein kinase [Planctomycetaceae bacterium]